MNYAEHYLNRLQRSNSRYESIEILREIERSSFPKESKLRILEEIRNILSGSRYDVHERRYYASTDNQELLNLINQMSNVIKEK